MQAIEHIIGATKAESVNELLTEAEAAKQAIDELAAEKLAAFQAEARRVLAEKYGAVQTQGAIAYEAQPRTSRPHP